MKPPDGSPIRFKHSISNCTFVVIKYFMQILILLFLLPSPSSCQFISQINQRGLKGNVTFDVRDDLESGRGNGSILEIEALLEADQSNWIQGEQNEDEFDSLQPILFDWTIHSNSLEPHMLNKCSSDDLGSQAHEDILKMLPNQRAIQLDQLNRWSLTFNKSTRELSSLIWSKSIRLKLAKLHEDKAGLDSSNKSRNKERPTSANPSMSDDVKPQPTKPVKPAITKPQLAFNVKPASASPPPGKPTFAPRPKPNISGRFQKNNPTQTSSAGQTNIKRSKRAATNQTSIESNSTLTSNNSTSVAALSTRESIIKSTHKRIVRLYGSVIVCGNIIDVRQVKTAQAVFESQVAGRVTIRGNEDDVTLLSANLYHIRSKVSTRHDWKIMASDILDHRREEERCRYLQQVLDPNNAGSLESSADACSKESPSRCRMGDLTKKHGQIQVAGQGRTARTQLIDLNLSFSSLEANSRPLYLVIFEVASKVGANGLPAVRQNIISCASISMVPAQAFEASFNMDGVRGSVKFSQRHSSEPTSISYDFFGLEGNIRHLVIHELPIPKKKIDTNSSGNKKLCSSLGKTFGGDALGALGNLTGRHGHLSVIDSDYEDHYMGEWVDLSLQLFGMHTIAGRSISLNKNNNAEPWVCAALEPIEPTSTSRNGEQQTTNIDWNYAEAKFFYPVVGRISFSQPADDPCAPTSVHVEAYNPNADKQTEGHNWLIHVKPAMADFYNWSARCESAGEVFDPILASVGLNNDAYSRQCISGLANEPLRCRLGDTSLKSNFKLTLATTPSERIRYYYVDPYLPLSGPNSILGRSVVLYDEMAPTQRGNRLACSTIKSIHSLRASVRSWDSGPSIPSNVRGLVAFEQEPYGRQTRAKLDLSGFNGNVDGWAIHQAWLTDDREFPCSNDSLYDVYDPFGTEQSSNLPPTAYYGSSATVDRVKVGDLSRKHGSLESLQSVQKQFRDQNLPLFASNSIIGRSIVLRAAVNDFRWVCGNVELDYDKTSAREIIGLASFDEPRSKVSGFVRFFQLEHKDGSLSDTFIQVDLGSQSGGTARSQITSSGGDFTSDGGYSSQEPQKTSDGHNWAIYVNQVGEDAFITADEVRCIAAGFKWNPYLAQDSLESYQSNQTCSPAEPEACAMGDLGQRHGALRLGPSSRRALSDSNLPLVGNYSIMGRSLVIFDNKRPNVKLACANIMADTHLKSNVVIKQTPSFTVARFIEQMRTLLDATEWLMVPELRATKSVANGECVQMTIHFYGQRAHQMQVELNNLITLGTVRRSTRIGVDKISTHYRMCRAGQSQAATAGGSNVLETGPSLLGIITYLFLSSALTTMTCFKRIYPN